MRKGLLPGFVLLAFFQAACNGEDADVPAPEPTEAGGIWEGTAQSAAASMEFAGVGVLADFTGTEDVFVVQMNSDDAVVNTTMIRL